MHLRSKRRLGAGVLSRPGGGKLIVDRHGHIFFLPFYPYHVNVLCIIVRLSEHNNTLTSHCSPSSVADAIDHIAERIMAKAAEQATRVVDREVWDADTSRCKKAKHAQQYTLLCDQSIHICIYFTSSIAWLCIIYRGVSARHRAGQEAREGDAGLTCGGA